MDWARAMLLALIALLCASIGAILMVNVLPRADDVRRQAYDVACATLVKDASVYAHRQCIQYLEAQK